MSDAGFADEAMEVINSKWNPSDIYGFLLSATKAYCPEHVDDSSGL